VVAVLAGLAAAWVGCKSPDLRSGTIECGPAGCPDGMECRDDGLCWRPSDYVEPVDASTEPLTLPSGAVVFVRAEVCPEGYKELETARGRAIVGAAPDAVVGQQVGEALSDMQERRIASVPAHLHSVALGTTSTDVHMHSHSEGGSETHDATGGGTRPQEVSSADSTITLGGDTHAHSVDIPEFSSGSTGLASVDVTTPYLQLLACAKQ